MAVIPQKARCSLVVEVGQRPTRYPIYLNLTEVHDIGEDNASARKYNETGTQQDGAEEQAHGEHERVASDDSRWLRYLKM